MEISFLAQLVKRYQSENPAFFKKLQRIAAIPGAGIIVVWLLLHFEIWMPGNAAKITSAIQYIFTFLAAVIATSSTTTKDPDLVSHDVKQAVIQDAIKQDNNVT